MMAKKLLNTSSSSCFNSSYPPLEQHFQAGTAQKLDIDKLYCTTEEVELLLRNLEVNKASGPDGVSAYMLKYTAASIAPSITRFFNYSLRSGKLPAQ